MGLNNQYVRSPWR